MTAPRPLSPSVVRAVRAYQAALRRCDAGWTALTGKRLFDAQVRLERALRADTAPKAARVKMADPYAQWGKAKPARRRTKWTD